MKEILERREYIIEAAKKFYYTNIKIYPDIEENCLSLIVDYEKDIKGGANLEVAFESYLRRELGILVSVVPSSKLNSLEKDSILSKCVDLDEGINEDLIKEKFGCPVDQIKFKKCSEENIDDVGILLADRQIERFEKSVKSEPFFSSVNTLYNSTEKNKDDKKRKSPPKTAGEQLFNELLSDSGNKKLKLEDKAMEVIQEFIDGFEEAAKKNGIVITHIQIEKSLSNNRTLI